MEPFASAKTAATASDGCNAEISAERLPGALGNSAKPMQMVAVLLETLDQHMSGRLDYIEKQINNLGSRMEGAGKFTCSIDAAPIAPNQVKVTAGVDDDVVDVDSHSNIKECLFRLSEAEATITGIRSLLTRVVNDPGAKITAPSLRKQAFQQSPAAAMLMEAMSDTGSPNGSGENIAAMPGGEEDALTRSPSGILRQQAEIDSKAAGLASKLNLSEETVRKVFGIFVGANKSADGLLTMDQLEMLLLDMCDGMIESTQMSFIMDKFDENRDGFLHFDEFITAFANTPLMKVAHIGDDIKSKGQETRNELAEAGMRLQPEDWVQMMGCRTKSLKAYVSKEILEAGSCLSMPLVFAMFFLYFFSVVLHAGYEKLHAVDNAISFDIKENANFAYGGDVPFENGRMGHKNIYDVNSFADFWSWMDLGLVPIFWAEDWELSEVRQNVYSRCITAEEAFDLYGWNPSQIANKSSQRSTMITANNTNPYFCADEKLPPRPTTFYENDRAGVYLYYHSVVAGVRLRQERGAPEKCPIADASLRTGMHRGQCVAPSGYFLKPERQTSFGIRPELGNQPGGKNVYLQSRKSQGAIRQDLHKLEDQVWLSPETAKVEVLFTLYNPHLDIFSATFIIVFMNRGGHMYKLVEPVSTHLTSYRNPMSYVVDISLLLLVLKIMFGEGLEIYRECRLKGGLKAGVKSYLSPGNFVDWLSVFYFFLLMGFWLAHLKVLQGLRESLRPASIDVLGSFEDVSDRDQFYDAVDEWVKSDSVLRTVMAIFPFIIGTRFFKIFALQPRLGVVTATLQSSFVDIVHFFMVFAAIFLVFVTSAMIIFGQELADFTNFSRCTTTVFRIMLGDYDSEDMIAVSRPQFAAWYWCFTWLVNLIMLNMLLAIVMDVHTEVKGHISSDAETMWSQVLEIIYRWNDIRVGRQIPLEQILEALEHHTGKNSDNPETDVDGNERLNLEHFMKMCPNMPEHQAMRILVSTYLNDEEEDTGRGASMSETSARVHHIFKNTQILHSSVERVIHMQEITAEMIANHFAAQRSHQHHKK